MVDEIKLDEVGFNVIKESTQTMGMYDIIKVGYRALREGKNVFHIDVGEDIDKVYAEYLRRRVMDISKKRGIDVKKLTEKSKKGLIREANIDFSKDNKDFGSLAIVKTSEKDFERYSKDGIERYLRREYEKSPFDVVLLHYYKPTSNNSKMWEVFYELSNNFQRKGFMFLVTIVGNYDNEGKIGLEEREYYLKKANKVIDNEVKQGEGFLMDDEYI